MDGQFKNVIALMAAVVVATSALGCSTTPAQVASTANIDATVEARVKELVVSQPKLTPVVIVIAKEVTSTVISAPTNTSAPLNSPLPTDTPAPTNSPVPTATPSPTATPILVSASTALPTATPVPTATPTTLRKWTPIPRSTPLPIATPAQTVTLIPVPPPTPVPTTTLKPVTIVPLWVQTAGKDGPPGSAVHLIAEGQRDTYGLISSKLGGDPVETPDCVHPRFGPHITQEWDDLLKKHIFVFHIHVEPDNDRCLKFDRQRTEIKTYDKSPRYLKGFLGETVTYRWEFKLDEGFQPSKNFTHIHQIKAVGGDDSKPLIVLTPRTGSPDVLEIGHYDSVGVRSVVATAPLGLFKGIWVEAYEKIIYGSQGSYWIELKHVVTGESILTYEGTNMDLWRSGAMFMRPKWGIYRSLNSQEYLRDEHVSFDQFCLAKGGQDCS